MEPGSIYNGNPLPPSPFGSNGGSQGRGDGFFSPLSLWRLILRRWATVLLLIALGGIIGLIYIRQAPKVYKAESVLEMSVRRPRVINSEVVFEDRSWNRDEGTIFNTRFAKFRSPAMEQLATQVYFERYPQDRVMEGRTLVGKYMLPMLIKDVVWNKDPKANIVRVSYCSSDPDFAAKLVNVLSDCAGLLMMQENRARSDEAVKWLTSQLEGQREELESVERKLATIREDIQLDILQQRKKALGQALVSISGEREALVSTVEMRKTAFRFVSELKATDPTLEVLPSGLPKEKEHSELIGMWRNAQEELFMVAERYKKIHPEYRTAAEKEARAKKRLQQFIQLSAGAVQNEIDLLGKQLKQVDERIRMMEKDALELEQQLVSGTQRLQRLERERDAADNAYQSMLRRMEEARLSADENMAFTTVIRKAEVPYLSIRPKKGLVLVASLFLGGMVGCLLIIVASLWKDRISLVSDLRVLKLNVLGTIPSQRKSDSRSELATLGLRDKFCRVVEIFAGINALISSKKYLDQSKVLLLSSAMPGEGKTVCACNLAASSAMNGVRTLLIDGDLRRPQLANIFAIDEHHPSLLDCLQNETSSTIHEELIAHCVVDNLDVIISRPSEDTNPAELLGRGQLAELIAWARMHYDRIIIDSPPLGPVGDAQVLVNHADSVIMVARIGKTRRRALQFTLTRFQEVDAFVLGCIANDVPHSLAGLFGGANDYGYSKSYKACRRNE